MRYPRGTNPPPPAPVFGKPPVKVAKQRKLVPMPKEPSRLEKAFAKALRTAGHDLPEPVTEYAFVKAEPPAVQRQHLSPSGRVRAWRFDVCWPAYRVAVELDGGAWMIKGGRHGGTADKQKINTAGLLGWVVINLTAEDLRDSAGCIARVREALRKRGWGQGRGNDDRSTRHAL